MGLALGLSRAGYRGAMAAWAVFTLPSAVALTLFALGISTYGDAIPAGTLHGLKIVAVAVVAHAVWGMAKQLCTGTLRITMMALATYAVLAMPTVLGQIGVIIIAAVLGLVLFKPQQQSTHDALPLTIRRRSGLLFFSLYIALLFGPPVLNEFMPNQSLALADSFYRAGSLVFGGGHVMLPLLQARAVTPGWVSNEAFLASYGAA